MAQNRYISTNFWKDNYVADLDPSEKLLFIYFLTNPKTTIAGVYEINLREVAFDTGFDLEMVKKIVERFMRDGKLFHAEGWVVLRNWIKWQQLNPSVKRGIDRTLQQVPDWLKEFILTDSDGASYGIDWDRLYTGSDILNLTKPNGTNLTKPNGTNEAEASRDVGTPKKRKRTAEIDGMFEFWSGIVGYKLTAKVKQNREAAGKLLNDYEKSEIAEAIRATARASEDRYAPRIANFVDLYRKWDELKLWDKKQMANSGVTRIL